MVTNVKWCITTISTLHLASIHLCLFFLRQILDSEEEYERFLQRSVERARQLLAKEHNGGSFQCRRPDCTGWCVIYNKNDVFEFKCPVCGTITCVRCGVSFSRSSNLNMLITFKYTYKRTNLANLTNGASYP